MTALSSKEFESIFDLVSVCITLIPHKIQTILSIHVKLIGLRYQLNKMYWLLFLDNWHLLHAGRITSRNALKLQIVKRESWGPDFKSHISDKSDVTIS